MNLIKSFHNRLPGKLLAVSVAVSMVLSTFALSDAYGLKDDHSGDPDYAQIDVVKEWTGGNPGVDTATFNILFTDGSSQSVTINGSPDETRWTGKAYIPKSKIGLYKGVEEALPGWAVTSCSDKVEFTRHLEKASSIERDEEYLIAAQGLPIVLGNLQNSFLTDVKNLDSLTYEKAKSQGFLWVSDRYNHFYSPDGKYSLNLYMDSYSGDYYFKVLRNMSANCTFSLENGAFIANMSGYGYSPFLIENNNHYVPQLYHWAKGDYSISFTSEKEEEPPVEEKPGEGIGLPISKKVIKQDGQDNRYNLELTATGKSSKVVEKKPLDILFVVDTTGSMKYSMNGDYYPNPYNIAYTRWNALTSAIKKFMKVTETEDSQYSVLTFSEGNVYEKRNNFEKGYDLGIKVPWTKDRRDVESYLDQVTADYTYELIGGTNYQGPFRYISTNTGEVLGSSKIRKNSSKVIVFLTDGVPTAYYDPPENGSLRDVSVVFEEDIYSPNYGCDNRNSYLYGLYDLKKVKGANAFYAVGISNSMNDTKYAVTGNQVMDGITREARTDTKKYFITPTSDELEKALLKIAESIKSIDITEASIHDTFSENIEPAPQSKVTIEVKDEKGRAVTKKEGTYKDKNSRITADLGDGKDITVSYNPDTKGLEAVFSPDYKVKQDWTYKVTMEVVPTEKAINEYSRKEKPQSDKADPDTGTYAGQNGIYTNENSKAYHAYKYGVSRHQQKYPKPVIKLPVEKTSLTVEKVWDDSSYSHPDITAKVMNGDKEVTSIVLNDKNNWKHTFDDLKKYDENGNQIKYTVKEVISKGNYFMEYSGGEDCKEISLNVAKVNGKSSVKGSADYFYIVNRPPVKLADTGARYSGMIVVLTGAGIMLTALILLRKRLRL